jgi:hypothetical protein
MSRTAEIGAGVANVCMMVSGTWLVVSDIGNATLLSLLGQHHRCVENLLMLVDAIKVLQWTWK